MSKILIFFSGIAASVLCLYSMNIYAQMSNVRDIRNKVFYTDFNLEKSVELIEEIEALNLAEPVIKAYAGSADILVAKHSWNPITKISFLKRGLKKVNEAVISDSKNIEIRFLRFYIENSLPRYLGLSDNLSMDKKVILSHLEDFPDLGLTRDIVSFISNYMVDWGECSKEEMEYITKSIVNLDLQKE